MIYFVISHFVIYTLCDMCDKVQSVFAVLAGVYALIMTQGPGQGPGQ